MAMKRVLQTQLQTELEKNVRFDSSLQQAIDYIKGRQDEEMDIFSEPTLRGAWFDLVTKRNQELISKEEQLLLKGTTAAFFGLSVGSHAALTWMMSSRANTIKVIDPDTIDITNLNRLRFGWETVCSKKTDILRREIAAISPETNVISYDEINRQMYTQVIAENPKPSIIIEETDDLAGKIYIRQLAKQYKIPVISATDVGDNVIVEIERYDTEPDTEPFLGRIPKLQDIDAEHMSPKERMKLVLQVVGLEECSLKMLDSLLAIGTTISTWPQLGSTATIAGGVLATTMKKIILNEPVRSGRYIISLDDIFTPEINDNVIAAKKERIAELYRRLT